MAKAKRYRLRFLSAFSSPADVVGETAIHAPDADAAVRLARETPWPRGALAMQLVGPDGREVYAATRADLRR